LPGNDVDENIIVIVFIGMPECKEQLVRSGRVFNRESEGGFKTTFPGMPRDRLRFFIEINRSTGIKKQGTRYKEQGNCYRKNEKTFFIVVDLTIIFFN
jgi:hypothetical protein